MKSRRVIDYLRFLGYAGIGSIFDLVKYRGYFLDNVARAHEMLSRETRLKAEAIKRGIRIVDPFVVFPGLEDRPAMLSQSHWVSSHDRVEYPLLSGICASLNPSTIFEFGTFEGEATLMFARLCPNARITTVNIPGNTDPQHALEGAEVVDLIPSDRIGWRFKGEPESERIDLILTDTAELDVTPYAGKFDFVWVDAGHSYENVKNDTEKAHLMAKEGGYIFWHDFDTVQDGVTRYLLEFSDREQLNWIERTSIVFTRKGSKQD